MSDLFNINVIITDNGSIPTIELRKVVKMNPENKQTFINVLHSAYNEQPLIILPTFSNKLQSISAMIKRGWIAEDVDKKSGKVQYRFLF